jgi:putative addiction module killer protein
VTFIVREYVDGQGRSPFRDWLGRLDTVTRARIQARILRFETGNLGDHRAVGRGLWEARLTFGPGYRVYFGRQARRVVLLLGGDTQSQKKDLARATAYWAAYLEEPSDDETQ